MATGKQISPADDIARRLAERLTPEIGPRLPVHVERAIAFADAGIEPSPTRSLDPAVVVALASFLVSLAQTAWSFYRDLAKPASEPLSSGEIALLREVLSDRVRQGGQLSDPIPGKLRIAAIEAAVDETVEEARRVEHRP
jgi:hypothetical protein